MKKLAKILTLAAAVLMLVTGCKKLPEFTQGTSNGGVTPTPAAGTLSYHLNQDPTIGSDYISISAKYSSDSEITEMRLAVSMKVDMPEGYTNYGEILINSYDISGTVTGLEPSTNYFWCILYIENGNSYKTEPVGFTTLENGGGEAPTVTTSAATEITTNSAVLNGFIDGFNASYIYNCGFYWGISSDILDHAIASETPSNGYFNVVLTGLTENTTYYYRAYATIDGSGNEGSTGDLVSFTTSNSNGDVPTGAINGLFSVSDTKQVYFSKGNLQYKASTNTWRFAENQWDYVGEANTNLSFSYNGWIDLFGWGTSGYNHGAVCYQPYSTSTDHSDYNVYGSVYYSLFDQTGQADWGYNAISNGGNVINTWRTLRHEQWEYLFYTRYTTSGIKFAKAQVNGVNGLILLPDDWNSSYYSLNSTNISEANYNTNIISSNTWESNFETHGAVFLPTAGTRENTLVSGCGTYGTYWSSSQCDIYSAWLEGFDDTSISTGIHRSHGRSVRLVHDAN